MSESNAENSELERMAQTILRQGELQLDGQLQIGLASDQRGSTLAAMLGGFAVALGGWAGWIALDSNAPWALAVAVGSSALMFGIGAGYCVRAVRPSDFYGPGSDPENWIADGALDKPLQVALLKEADNYSHYIALNRATLFKTAALLQRGLNFAALAPLVGALAGVAAWLLCMYLR